MTDRPDLDELEALEKAATPRPWRYVRVGKFRHGSIENGIGTLYGPDCLIYTTPCDPGCLDETFERQACDGELNAALRNAAPAMIAELRQARELLREAAVLLCGDRFGNVYDIEAAVRIHSAIRAFLARTQEPPNADPS